MPKFWHLGPKSINFLISTKFRYFKEADFKFYIDKSTTFCKSGKNLKIKNSIAGIHLLSFD